MRRGRRACTYGSAPASRMLTRRATVLGSQPASWAADQLQRVRSKDSRISMISLADFVNVPSGGLLDGVETSSQPAGRGSCADANTTSAVRPPGFLVSVSRE